MSSDHYIARFGRIIDSEEKTWRFLSNPKDQLKCQVQLEDQFYILDSSNQTKEIDISDESYKPAKRDITKMAEYICKTWANQPDQATRRWKRGEGWRAPETIWPSLAELCQEYITDPEKLEFARMYFNDEYKP